MNVYQLLDALGEIDSQLLMDVKLSCSAPKKRLQRSWVLLAAVIAALALCGFAAYRLALSDQWLQNPSQNPTETVKSAIENQMEKEYTLAVQIEQIAVDEAETTRAAARYRGSDLARARGWTDEHFNGHFAAVRAKYWIVYDHTKTFLDDGQVCQYFYLIEDPKTGQWTIVDNITTSENQLPES